MNYKKNIRIIIGIVLLFCYFTTYAQQYRLKTIVIDPGHGGKDPGTIGGSLYEKDIVLAVSLKLGELIKQKLKDVNLIFTRKSDVFIELNQRSDIANNAKADLFISIHVNASPKNNLSCGTETYIMGLHRAQENFEVAKRENSVISIEENSAAKYEDFNPNSPDSYLIFSLMQNKYLEQSLFFAASVQSSIKQKNILYDRGVKQAGFLVLRKTAMPSVLIELGFSTCAEDEQYLVSEKGQEEIAESIFNAINDYKNTIENNQNVVKTKNENIEIEDKENRKIEQKKDYTGEKGIFFKIQLMSSNQQVPLTSSRFKGLQEIEEYLIDGIYKYTYGNQREYSEISKKFKKVKDKFPSSFIVAFENGEKISISNALAKKRNDK